MARYAWVITRDLANPYGERAGAAGGHTEPTRVGLWGPSGATPAQVLRALEGGEFFQLRDGAGAVHYEGRCWWRGEARDGAAYGPLHDWGVADLGATTIAYRVDGLWRTW